MRFHFPAVILALTAFIAGPAQAASHTNQQIGQVLIDGRPCLFFILKNVPQADPAVPGQLWFALPTTNANYQSFASILLSAKVSGQPVNVQTDGTIACGYATVSTVGLN